jgi:glutathione S-transferase
MRNSIMLQLYGIPRSRANRCLWMLEEMGRPYELVERTAHPDDLQTAEYLRLNPNARIPTLVDGDLVLWESLVINLYLAQKYEGPMHAGSVDVVAKATQWTLWAALEIEPLALDLIRHRAFLADFARDASDARRDELLLRRPLEVLNVSLDGREYLLGDDFTVGDLNVAVILSWARRAEMDLSHVPAVDRWLGACLDRPAYKRMREMMGLN